MNSIKKIAFLLSVIISLHQTISIQALPNGGGLGNRIHKGNSNSIKNNGLTLLKNNTSQTNNNNIPAPASTVQQNNQTENTQPENQTNAPLTESNENNVIDEAQTQVLEESKTPEITNDTTIDPNTAENSQPETDTSLVSTNPTDNQNAPTTTSNTPDDKKTDNKPHEDAQITIPDQETILKTLQDINNQDAQNHMLLNEHSMSQLFNNFVYFKNFIVENFTKEKMIRLCIEFINQLYPKETVVADQTIQNISTISENSSTQDTEPETIDNSQQEEQAQDSSQDTSIENDNTQQNNLQDETQDQDYAQDQLNENIYDYSQNMNENTTENQNLTEEQN